MNNLPHHHQQYNYLSDKEVNAIERSAALLLEEGKNEREQDLQTSLAAVLAEEESDTQQQQFPVLSRQNIAEKKRRTKQRQKQRLRQRHGRLATTTPTPTTTTTTPTTELPRAHLSALPTLSVTTKKIITRQQLKALVAECTRASNEEGDSKLAISAASAAFEALDQIIRTNKHRASRTKQPRGAQSSSKNQQYTVRDAAGLFTALASMIVASKNDLVRSHVSLNMISLLRNLLPLYHRDLPLNIFAETIAHALSERKQQTWSTLGDDLRIVSALSEHNVLSVAGSLALCDPMSEIWLTEANWSESALNILTNLVLHHLSISEEMQDFVLRLSNVALGVFHKLEGLQSMQGKREYQEQQHQILSFLLAVGLQDGERTRTKAFTQEINDLVLETLRAIRKMHLTKQTTLSVDSNVVAVEDVSPGIQWLKYVMHELNIGRTSSDDEGDGPNGDWNGNDENITMKKHSFNQLTQPLSLPLPLPLPSLSSHVRIAALESSCVVIAAVPRVLTPLHQRTPYVSPKARSPLLDQSLKEMKTKTLQNDSTAINAAEDPMDTNNTPRVMQSSPVAIDTVIHHVHHVHHSPTSATTIDDIEALHNSSTLQRSPNMSPRGLAKLTIKNYLLKTCYSDSEHLVLDTIGLQQFAKQIIFSNEHDNKDKCLSQEDCQRFCEFMNKSGNGTIALEDMITFVQQGMLLDRRKRMCYIKKSSLHQKLMTFVLEVWRKSVEGRDLW